jgi:hypothetical protein
MQLRADAQRNFRVWMHELPLHVMGKSLLRSDKVLYDRAIRLHDTRNRIVHRGEPATEEKLYGFDRQGALQAAKCALAVRRWYGWRGEFPLPVGGFVHFPSATRAERETRLAERDP